MKGGLSVMGDCHCSESGTKGPFCVIKIIAYEINHFPKMINVAVENCTFMIMILGKIEDSKFNMN